MTYKIKYQDHVSGYWSGQHRFIVIMQKCVMKINYFYFETAPIRMTSDSEARVNHDH